MSLKRRSAFFGACMFVWLIENYLMFNVGAVVFGGFAEWTQYSTKDFLPNYIIAFCYYMQRPREFFWGGYK